MNRSFVLVLLIIAACSPDEPGHDLPAYDGIASFNTNLSANEPFSNYAAEFKAAYDAGARGAQLAAPWKNLNPSGTTYDLTPINNQYFGFNVLKDMGFEQIFVNLGIITIGSRSMPADLAGLSFDDPVVKSRLRSLIDAVMPHFNDKVVYVSLGNEVDTYFASHAGEWLAFIRLVEDARTYIKTKNPSVIVGVTTTFHGATVGAASEISMLNSELDAIMLTYYPINSDFTVRDPSAVEADVHKMLVLAGNKPIVAQEWGYPSSSILGSSEEKQAEFFAASMTALKEHGAGHFPFVSFFKYRDWNAAHCQAVTGQSAGQTFFEFMASLGLKTNEGAPKKAYAIVTSALTPR